jgi:hypothetical protein
VVMFVLNLGVSSFWRSLIHGKDSGCSVPRNNLFYVWIGASTVD